MNKCTNCGKTVSIAHWKGEDHLLCNQCVLLCEMCRHNKHCQHHFDYQCQKAFDFLKGEKVPIWAIGILKREVSRSGE